MKPLFIFNFHRISDEFSPAYPPIPVKVFEKIIKFLKNNFTIIDERELTEVVKENNKKIPLIITFDDGFYDFKENALPILEKYNIPVTQHIVTKCAETGESFWTQELNKAIETYFSNNQTIEIQDFIYKHTGNTSTKEIEKIALNLYLRLLKNPAKEQIIENLLANSKTKVQETKILSWDDINLLPKDLVSIGSHTHSHINLAELSENEIYSELLQSFNLIYEKTGIKPASIAFPNGQYNEKVIEISKQIGYKIGYTVNCKKNFNFDFLLHRYDLYSTNYWKNGLKIMMYKYK